MDKKEIDAGMKIREPGEEHRKLETMVGTYNMTMQVILPGAPTIEDKGTAIRTMFDGRTLIEELSSTCSMPGFHADVYRGHRMIGYDRLKSEYWLIWVDSMMTWPDVNTGSCDENGKFTFECMGASPKGEFKLRTTLECPDESTEIYEVFAPDPEGNMRKMIVMTYERQ